MPIRITKLTVVPKGEPIFSLAATDIEIEDEAAGDFITLTQETDDTKNRIAFDIDEWSEIAEAVERIIADIKQNAQVEARRK